MEKDLQKLQLELQLHKLKAEMLQLQIERLLMEKASKINISKLLDDVIDGLK